MSDSTTSEQGLDQFPLNYGNFGYSAVGLDNLGSSKYTLWTVALDTSGSLIGFETELQTMLKLTVEEAKRGDYADQILFRELRFASSVNEVRGFTEVDTLDLSAYDQRVWAGGGTALYDAAYSALEATIEHAKVLRDGEYTANGVVIVITDGCDNGSRVSRQLVKETMVKATQSETLESLITILIAINADDTQVQQELDTFQKDIGFDFFYVAKDLSPKTIATVTGILHSSVKSQSKSLGSGKKDTSFNPIDLTV